MSAKQTIIPVFVPHLGCRKDCVFCNQRRISGAQRPVTAGEVAAAIVQGAAQTPAGARRQLAFYGGSFTAIPPQAQEELLQAAQPFLRDGTLHSIRMSTRPDAIDGEILRRLACYGVETIELGAQSMDDRVLELSGRGHTAQAVADASRMVKAHGFRLILQMMTGLPGDEDGQASISTARRIIELRPDGVRIYPTVIVADTPLYDLWRAGAYKEHTVEAAVDLCARLVPLFERTGIPIIRLGLNPTEELSAGAAAAGAYHPALGELVRSRIFLNAARVQLQGIPPGSTVILEVPKGRQSQMTGQHRENLRALEREFALSSARVRENPAQTEENPVICIAKQQEM